MSVYLPVDFPVEPYAVTHCANTICARHCIFRVQSVKKNPAKQDSPPAAGRASDILPFRCSAIRAERFLSYGNEVSYTIKRNVPWHILAPRRGCFGNHLPLCRVRILVEHLLSYGNEVSYTIINARCQVSCKAPGISVCDFIRAT